MRLTLQLIVMLCLVCGFAGAKEKEKPGKNASWPPRAGVKTPGVQIPIANLKAEAELTLEGTPSFLFAEGMAISVPLRDKGVIARIGNRDNKATDSWKGFEEPCGGMISAFGNLWVPDCKKQSIARVEPRSGKIAASVEVGVGKGNLVLAANADSVWVLSDEIGTLSRVDPKSNHVVSELRLGPSCNTVQFEQDALWVTCPKENQLLRIDPKTNLVEKRIETAKEPIAVVFGEAHLWVLGNLEGKVSKIDPKTNKVVATIETGVSNGGGNLAFGDGQVWVSAAGYPLTKIHAQNDKVMQQFVGDGGGMVRFGLGSIWLVNPAKMSVARIDPKRVAATLPD
ncbi:YncE family protein [Bryobacter aggregatus]|uniref:Vgb family protein n=1 Tax=Bryobacter aggregatus TaxID=360054 RepID=UPI0004E1833D|nr:YncE family protein [Bryobacter aggregatus]